MEGTVAREITLAERVAELERQLRRVTRIAERQRERVDQVFGSEPEPLEKDSEIRYAR